MNKNKKKSKELDFIKHKYMVMSRIIPKDKVITEIEFEIKLHDKTFKIEV